MTADLALLASDPTSLDVFARLESLPSIDEVVITSMEDDRPPRGNANVYFVWTSLGDLLYVGQSRDVRRRLLQHRAASPWWCYAATCTVVRDASLDEADLIERNCIESLAPLFNVQHNRRAR